MEWFTVEHHDVECAALALMALLRRTRQYSITIIDEFDWASTVKAIKALLDTNHGRRGFLTLDCMYFAIPATDDEDFWVQIDVKACCKPELFTWYTFELNYTSNSKIIGSMVKPSGLTLDPNGFHIRVEEMEDSNFSCSMIWVSKDPRDVMRVVGLDRRLLDAGFNAKAEICLFNASHFAARLADEKYFNRPEDRAPHWMHFRKEWLPKRYLSGQDSARQEKDLQTWYKHTRAAVRDKVFTMFLHIAVQYYIKRAAHLKEAEEHRLRDLITGAILAGTNGWESDFLQPVILFKQLESTTPRLQATTVGVLTSPLTPTMSIEDPVDSSIHHLAIDNVLTPPPSPSIFHQTTQSSDVPLYLDRLDRTPQFPYIPRPPPANMSPEAKLLCLARWTHFDPETGVPHILSEPHPKVFNMHWAEAAHAGATDKALVEWAKNIWWLVWIRQSHVNYGDGEGEEGSRGEGEDDGEVKEAGS
ncbi:hypothetical protein T440DRAFT_491768 [Plenodomus tracheiphilus IPT5]|uniref:Uncharacterized protein n=1 Tax=Plenodomus tracheiphilus IPT5 TaxID=1408161 RepID=A0A6A7AY97_9PLEO|nr:hypothetical protein T440DRAFT_491768 [Plenodomus tracheiphilus IPT5]